MPVLIQAGADPGLLVPEAYTIFVTSTKLGMKVNIYLGSLPGP